MSVVGFVPTSQVETASPFLLGDKKFFVARDGYFNRPLFFVDFSVRYCYNLIQKVR